MKVRTVIACLVLTVCISLIASEKAPRQASRNETAKVAEKYASEGYKLVWADEFDKDGRPDPTKWTYELGFRRNRELQWYQKDNVRCENGLLIIEGRRERVKNPNYKPGTKDWRTAREFAEYTSASLKTQGLHSWTYGRFEMRGKIDIRPGLWPAFWTLGASGRWPAGGEIDIMEYYKRTLLANVAWYQNPTPEKRGRTKWDDVKIPIEEFGAEEWAKDFHVWRMDWDENRIELSVDGRVLNTTDLKDTVNPEGVTPRNPFHHPQYILVNLAIGGASGGDPSNTEFPSRFEVDYVRVYQKK